MLKIESIKVQAGKVLLTCSDDGVVFSLQAEANLPKVEDYFALVKAEAARVKQTENTNVLRQLVGVDINDDFAVFQASQGKAGQSPVIPKG